ncbi:aminotransferase class V-fold PLP-dependent enzyme [Pseudidiomarina insulisalsae]|uniref:Probable cysteine desulfurase n=1 Tax=Pseudidiomarina insulisalsae TaxID=575789 RepID=A0A432YF30_9GAMM|nr:aminotransferase class V-fold PLP-dependent enzyme [Pseudidiomarina insulisalsae]RUO59515.1 cysteine desulfurase CsdA [Pseudidiomarina insulisalsae]
MPDYPSPRQEFALFRHEPELVYLDSAASCQVPDEVLSAYLNYYQHGHANAHRGSYPLAQQATAALENARASLATFIGATSSQIAFTPGATYSINLLANGLELDWQAGDEIVVSRAEHHANFLPWQRLAQRYGLRLRWLDLDPRSGVLTENWREVITPSCKLVAITLASNVTGQILPVAEIARHARPFGAVTVVDAAQAVGSVPLDVVALQCDALTFSAHKMYSVTGCGVLYVSDALQARLQPLVVGGGMVTRVEEHSAEWVSGVHALEAGTPNTAAIIAGATAAQWLRAQRERGLTGYLQQLTQQLREQLQQRNWLQLLPYQGDALPLISFYAPNIHAFDLASFLAEHAIAVRAGSHCAQPLLRYWQHEAVVRVSLAAYNTAADCERLCAALDEACQLFAESD